MQIDSTDPEQNQSSSVYLLQVAFAVYICITTIIMCNLLISMMNDTYADKKENSAKNERLSFLNLLCSSEQNRGLNVG